MWTEYKQRSIAYMRARNKHIQNIGHRFGKLVVNEVIHKDGAWRFICQCDCGKETTARCDNVLCGKTASCGCSMRKGLTQKGDIFSVESLNKRTQTMLGITMAKARKHPELPKYITINTGNKSKKYLYGAFYVNRKMVYCGTSTDVPTLMKAVADKLVAMGLWTEKERSDYYETYDRKSV